MRVDVFRIWVTNPVGQRQELKRDTAIDRKPMEIIRHQGSPRPYRTGPGPVLVQYFAFFRTDWNSPCFFLKPATLLSGPGPEHVSFMSGSVLDNSLTLYNSLPQSGLRHVCVVPWMLLIQYPYLQDWLFYHFSSSLPLDCHIPPVTCLIYTPCRVSV